MRTFVALALALAAGAALAQAPSSDPETEILEQSAAEDSGTTSEPPPDDDDVSVTYSGLGVTRVSTDFDNLGEAINLQLILGFRIPTVPWFGVELDFQSSVIPGENEGVPASPILGGGGGGTPCIGGIPDLPPGCTVGGGGGGGGGAPSGNFTNDPDEFGMNAAGLSAVLRSTGRFYAMGRYGYRYVQTSIEELNEKRSGTAWGLGVGYRWSKSLSGVELGYHQLTSEMDYLGLMFSTTIER